MYATILQYQVERGGMDAAIRVVQDDFVPLVSTIPGFVSFDVVDAGDRLATIGMFQTQAGAEEAGRRAAAFVDTRPALAARLAGRQATLGSVRVHRALERGLTATTYTLGDDVPTTGTTGTWRAMRL